MTGAASSNVTTQWTFRDGRDYVLSLSTTEVPNTMSFSICDKITGEEWTCCYDENCIEIITKRTGCFKSFDVFLSMIKSALFKKSEAVMLDLLNIQDLAAISINRQRATPSADCGYSYNTPLNFELFNSEVNMSSTNRLHAQPQTVPSTETNSNIDNNGSHKPPPPSPLNKRKYLIVSYIGEFDKVHYPLPLNYSNPPDLNVMQNNIIKLKAEVTSLKSAKKELKDQLESIKLSGGIPQHSHENNSNDVNIGILLPSTLNSNGMMGKERVFYDQIQNSNEQIKNAKNHVGGGTVQDAMNGGVVDESKLVVYPTCVKCSVSMKRLQETVRSLENTMDVQKNKFFQSVEKLENENRFLRQKVETSEKYEMELWSQIKALREKVEMKENLDKARKIEAMKDTYKNRCHRSRHELFYNMKQSGDAKPAKPFVNGSPVNMGDITTAKMRTNCDRHLAENIFNQRSRSNSTASNVSVGRNCNNESRFDRNRAVSRENRKIRSSSSSYHAINFIKQMPKGRSGSFSPLKKFDPTAYVTEKKLKQGRIANLRIQRIESRIQTGSAGSLTRRPSQSPCTSPHLRGAPTYSQKNRRSFSQENAGIDKNMEANNDTVTVAYSRKDNFISQNGRVKDKTSVRASRQSSEESGKTKILSYVIPRLPRGEKLTKTAKNVKNVERDVKNPRKKLPVLSRDLDKNSSLITALKDSFFQSPTKKLVSNTKRKSKMSSIAVNTSFTCDQLDSLIALDEKPKLTSAKEKDEKCDITFLQEKLSALNAFLETCKSTKDYG